jgi:hypothetical protein
MTLTDYLTQREIIIAHWSPLLQAADMWDERYTPDEIYDISTVLLRDAELTRAWMVLAMAHKGPMDEQPVRADALALWTADQKAALKQRVVGKLGSRKE